MYASISNWMYEECKVGKQMQEKEKKCLKQIQNMDDDMLRYKGDNAS